MPATFSVATHPANRVKLHDELQEGLTVEEIIGRNQYSKPIGEVLQFSLGQESGRNLTARFPHLRPDNNGFVNTVVSAYNHHHALIIRPDDVWLAILCQFNYFVNANAELLRASFVAHEGKRTLELVALGVTRYSFDFGDMSRQMVGLIEKNIVDPTLRDWAIPTFTTTTPNDVTTSAVLLMATLKSYFKYRMVLTRCGIPRVTLEGEKADWVDILGRLEKLKEYGLETIAWYHLLRPVIARFVAAFDAPDSTENVKFWSQVVDYRQGSGWTSYSGWITAFNAFSKDGKWLGKPLDKNIVSTDAPDLMPADAFWAAYAKPSDSNDLVLDCTPFHRVERIEPAYAEVAVDLNDNDEKFDCVMVAGMFGMQVSSSGDATLSENGEEDTVGPVSGWCIFTAKGPHAMDTEE
ncbi:hypothetical protein B0H11DRAFT_2171205 [Mycena galericulata]|nr:hypothetical protein B0H11DRAFT_2171205 [Mycena galericulata]